MCQRVSVQHLREITVGCGIMKKVVDNLSRSLKVLTVSITEDIVFHKPVYLLIITFKLYIWNHLKNIIIARPLDHTVIINHMCENNESEYMY